MCVRGCAGRRAHERAQASGRVRTYVCVPERTGVRMGVRVRMCARERGLILPTLLYINPLPSA